MKKYVRKNHGEKKLVLEGVLEVEAPTIRKVIEKGAGHHVFYYYKLILCQYSV